MEYKFLKINGIVIWGQHKITKTDLEMVKDGRYDTIINIERGTMFNADENKWVEIEGEK